MAQRVEKSEGLPEGVRVTRGDGPDPIELTIRAADVGQLAWKIHDLIPLIQSGRLAKLIEPPGEADGRPGATPE